MAPPELDELHMDRISRAYQLAVELLEEDGSAQALETAQNLMKTHQLMKELLEEARVDALEVVRKHTAEQRMAFRRRGLKRSRRSVVSGRRR